jgi:hypothetical protein
LGSIADIDTLLQRDDEQIEFKAKDKNVYMVTLFVPSAVALIIVNHADVLDDVFHGRFKPSAVGLVLEIISAIFKPSYDFMTPEWIENNISLIKLIAITNKVAKPVYDFLLLSGLIPAGTVPEKAAK